MATENLMHFPQFVPMLVRTLKRGSTWLKSMITLSLLCMSAVSSGSPFHRLITFFSVAGHETTAGAIAFSLWALGQNQEIQTALRDELLAFPGEPTYDDLANRDTFPLLDAVCKEGYV